MQVRLREAMDAYKRRTGQKVTYESLSDTTGISVATLQSLAARPGYNATLATIEKICRALRCQPGDLLQLENDDNGHSH
jgi:DNA-binding Xre family transcriptional regulator